ncbi:hypothetical protein C8Q80DRAFT_122942 [Daedaleopsis nitida]|nr:hypothetical protein C8Q80DRAFT_122942 [Daedaleopsis nitida]
MPHDPRLLCSHLASTVCCCDMPLPIESATPLPSITAVHTRCSHCLSARSRPSSSCQLRCRLDPLPSLPCSPVLALPAIHPRRSRRSRRLSCLPTAQETTYTRAATSRQSPRRIWSSTIARICRNHASKQLSSPSCPEHASLPPTRQRRAVPPLHSSDGTERTSNMYTPTSCRRTLSILVGSVKLQVCSHSVPPRSGHRVKHIQDRPRRSVSLLHPVQIASTTLPPPAEHDSTTYPPS